MKTTIRRNCFETNSSSSHTITITKNDYNRKVPKKLHIEEYKYEYVDSEYHYEIRNISYLLFILMDYIVDLDRNLQNSLEDYASPEIVNKYQYHFVNLFKNNLKKWGYNIINIDEFVGPNATNITYVPSDIDDSYMLTLILPIITIKEIFEQYISNGIVTGRTSD